MIVGLGGHVEDGGSDAEAAVREAWEEAGHPNGPPSAKCRRRAALAYARVRRPRSTRVRIHRPDGRTDPQRKFNPLVDWMASVAKIGAPGLHIHDLRLTGNTLPAAARASNRDLMARMGHDSTIGHIDRSGERQSTASAGAFALPHRGLLAWSGRRESNPHYQLGRLKFCH
jgi:8-oxo-dGTP pyrophosphatase MutT (NUDIX family)